MVGGFGQIIAIFRKSQKYFFVPPFLSKNKQKKGLILKEVCNGGVACSLLKLGSLEKTVIASLFHSGLHSSSPFFVEKTTLPEFLPS